MASLHSESRDFPKGVPPAAAQVNAEASELEESTPLRYLQRQLLLEISEGRFEGFSEQDARLKLDQVAEDLARQMSYSLDVDDKATLIERALHEFFGFGPIHDLMREPDVSEILINGPRQVFVEKRGQLQPASLHFRDEAHLTQVLERMIVSTGRRLDRTSPILDVRLPDGSRLNVVLKPPALNGPLVSIRRFGTRPLTADDLLANGTLTEEMLSFLGACIKGRISMVVSGGSGSGKTTLLNALSRFVAHAERVVTVEDTAELELQQPHVAKLEALPANANGEGAVSMRELVRNALRMRPDRILVGECRGPETLEMLQAMNTGHEGSLTTIHANSPREAIARVELMIGLAGIDISTHALRKLVSSSIHLVVQIARLLDGRRKVVSIAEITGMEEDVVSMHELFEFVQTGVNNQTVDGYFRATGIRPKCLNRLFVRGASLPADLFVERRLPTQQSREASR